MKCDRPLTLLLCSLIVGAAWLAAATRGVDRIMLAGAITITLLCVAIMLHHLTIADAGIAVQRPTAPVARDEAAEFRRVLFNLCAALKLGLRFCEDHLDSEPEVLIEQLQQMSDHINSFVNHTTCSVRFYHRAWWQWRPRVWWPWRPRAR